MTEVPAIDRGLVDRFAELLFRYADEGTYVHLRAFRDGGGEDGVWRPDLWKSVELDGAGLAPVVDAAVDLARACAIASESVVFAAPIATFTGNGATETDLANGVALTVECDQQPEAARTQLALLLGKPTVVVESGGWWTNPVTGKTNPKLHLHWRLTEPTRSREDHAKLKEARRLAAARVGGDQTAMPPCHPLRWPGSVHRKKEPRLVQIAEANPDAEIELDDALDLLREIDATPGISGKHRTRQSSEPEADPRDIAAALALIPNVDLPWDEWNRVGMATWRASNGTEEGFRGFDVWSAKSGKYDAAVTRARWDHYFASPPMLLGAGTLFHLARQYAPGWRKPTTGPTEQPVVNPAAPYDTARVILDRYEGDGRPLRRHRGVFYTWNGAAYTETDGEDVRAAVYRFLAACLKRGANGNPKAVKPTQTMVSNLIDALRSVALVSSDIEPPAWLGELRQPPTSEIIACANGLLHLPTLTLLPASPELFTVNALDFAFDGSAPQPAQWLAFLGQLWPDDPQAISTLQEIFGYCLTADTSQQKMFLIVGPKRSGKGTIGRVLTRLVGKDNAVAPTLASLGTNFGLAPLIGKRVAVISDARLGGRADQAAIAERLLSISGEDSITIDRKYREAWTGRLGVRFLVLTNELPRLADASGALPSRFIVLVLTESFFGREDTALTDKLLFEMPSILNWSIEGWRRLSYRGYFVQPESARDAMEQLEELASPIGTFVRDCCDVGAGYNVAVEKLFERWKEWCTSQGRDHPGTVSTFGKDLKAAIPGVKTTQPRGADGRQRVYQGAGLKK